MLYTRKCKIEHILWPNNKKIKRKKHISFTIFYPQKPFLDISDYFTCMMCVCVCAAYLNNVTLLFHWIENRIWIHLNSVWTEHINICCLVACDKLLLYARILCLWFLALFLYWLTTHQSYICKVLWHICDGR